MECRYDKQTLVECFNILGLIGGWRTVDEGRQVADNR